RSHLFADVIQFFVAVEEQGNVQSIDACVDSRKAYAGQGDGLQLADADFSEHLGVVAQRASGVDAQLDFSAGDCGPVLLHAHQDFVPSRALGNNGAQVDANRAAAALSWDGSQRTDEQNGC